MTRNRYGDGRSSRALLSGGGERGIYLYLIYISIHKYTYIYIYISTFVIYLRSSYTAQVSNEGGGDGSRVGALLSCGVESSAQSLEGRVNPSMYRSIYMYLHIYRSILTYIQIHIYRMYLRRCHTTQVSSEGGRDGRGGEALLGEPSIYLCVDIYLPIYIYLYVYIIYEA